MTKRRDRGRAEHELARALLGDDEAAWAAFDEAAWYGPLRRALRNARRSAGLTQSEVAMRLGKDQSEISRLEIGLTDRVPIGLIKNFFDACGATLQVSVRDRQGQELVERTHEDPSRLAGDIAAQVLRGLEEAAARFEGPAESRRSRNGQLRVEAFELTWSQVEDIMRPQQGLMRSTPGFHEEPAGWEDAARPTPPSERLDMADLGERLSATPGPFMIEFPDGQKAVIFPAKKD